MDICEISVSDQLCKLLQGASVIQICSLCCELLIWRSGIGWSNPLREIVAMNQKFSNNKGKLLFKQFICQSLYWIAVKRMKKTLKMIFIFENAQSLNAVLLWVMITLLISSSVLWDSILLGLQLKTPSSKPIGFNIFFLWFCRGLVA